jgi:hypothetical protein
MKSDNFLQRLLVFLILLIFPVFFLSGQNLFQAGNMSSDEPMPPDSVYAQILGPDSAMYISWQAPPDSGLVLEGYDIYRLSDFDPEGDPATGVQTWILTHNWPACSDPEWPDLNYGWYAYGVRAVYTNGMKSELAVSNVVGHDMYCSITVSVGLENNDTAGDAHVLLFGKDYTYQQYSGRDSVNVTIDSVMKGHYLIAAYNTGYDSGYIENALIFNDTLIEIQLLLKKRQVYDLTVDSISLIATWSEPEMIAIWEDFEGEQFPPPGWQLSSADEYGDWFRTLDGSSGGFLIPPGDGHYACDNVDMHGSDPHNSCCDYLITPPLDLTESDNYRLEFDSYYTGAYGQLAFVEYSYDRGETWEVMMQLTPGNIWQNISPSLGAFSGEDKENPLWIAFHADWAGGWASGWAVDNVKIYVPGSQVDYTDFNVFLDDSLVTNTTNTSWNFAPLNYGQQYTASVSVNYPYGTSKKDYCSFTSRYLPPPLELTAQAEGPDVTLQWNPPSEGLNNDEKGLTVVPGNLLGYSIYKNDVFLDFILHSGEDEPQVYIDSNNLPGYFDFEVSGVYDLEPYGFPGDTGESVRSVPAGVSVDYCTALDFHEDWDSGTFSENQWQTEGDGWKVSNDYGNPQPGACFNPDTTLVNYSSILTSYPFCAAELSEGEIWLDFDLNLISNINTGDEKLKVEIWNRVMNNWKTIREYSNLTGNISWNREHINVGMYSFEKIFMLRFIAEGLNSADIMSWCIDNIDIRRICPGPDSLYLEVIPEELTIELHWIGPDIYHIDTELFWGDGEFSGNSIGTGDAVEFDVAQRWEPAQLMEFSGASVTEVAFFPMEPLCYYQVRIWTGPNAENLVLDQPYTPITGQWNVVTLDQPFLIDADQELWIGYHANTVTGYPAGVDDGPAVDGYGNMMNFGGWQTLLEINPALDYNWCIKAHVMTIDNKKITLLPNKNGNLKAGKTRELSGFNIYRKLGITGDYVLIDFMTEGPCIYTVIMDELYCFRVSAVWYSEYDECESELTDEACAMISVGVYEPEDGATLISLYPNPAKDVIMISSSEIIKQIVVYNLNGNKINDAIIDDNTYSLQTACFSDGLYLIKIIAGTNTHSYKIAVIH